MRFPGCPTRRRAIFPPIEKTRSSYPTKYYEKIIVSINERVLRGDLKQGDKLPSERELAEQFQTSRVPVREAMKILEFLGIIENMHGDGMYIKNIEIPSLLSKIFFAFDINNNTIQELFTVRLLLECYAARSAAALRSDEDLHNMQRALEDMENAVSFFQAPAKASLDFHLTVVKAAQNSILVDIYKFLAGLLALSRERTLSNYDRQTDSLNYHRQIFQMIEQQNVEGAERCMREHLLDERDRLKA